MPVQLPRVVLTSVTEMSKHPVERGACLRLLRLLYTVPLRFRSLFRRDQVERDLEDEFRDHLERQVEAGIARGLTHDEARHAAMCAFGGMEQRKEECRDMRHVNLIEHWLQDLRFAVRQILRHRGFASTAIVVPALGIAASVALFGFVDAAMIKPLPYAEPSRLVTVFGARPDLAPGQNRGAVSYLDFLDWRERIRTFSSVAAYDVRAGFTLESATGPERVPGLRVTSGFFRTLGVTPLIGREFGADEDGAPAPPTVVISYAAWQKRFGGNPDVLGQTVTLQSPWLGDAEPHVVIGVLPRDFHFPMAEHAEFWATIRGAQACWGIRSCRSLETIARLANGVSVQAASADMTSVLEQLRREYPDQHRSSEVAKLVSLRDVMLGDVGRVLTMLLAASLLLLVIACTNVTSLMLARTDSRAREIAVRNALGASSPRLVLQFATEALVLATIAGALGVLLASLGTRFLSSLLTPDMISRMPYLQGIGFNARLVVFAVAIAAVVACVFALTPLARISVSGTLARLKDDNRGTAGSPWRRLGAHLVVAELAVAVVLLVGAGLLGRSLYRLIHVEVGFNAQQLAGVSVIPGSLRITASDSTRDSSQEQPGVPARRIAERVALLPGVQSVGYADLLPLSAGLAPSSTFWLPGRANEEQLPEDWPVRRISAHYLTTLQARLLRGRYFTEEEVASVRPVMIINASAAGRYFRGEDPIGQSIALGGAASPARQIVGVVADIKDGPPETPTHPSAYVPFDQTAFALAVRLSQSEQTLFPTVRAAIREIRPDALVGELTTIAERANRLPSTSLQRSTAWLIGAFAAIAFVLSVVGLYGVVAYSVGQRTREIGVRVALGAQRRTIYRLVLVEASWLAGLGTGFGLICAVVAATLMRNLLFDVSSWDPLTFFGTGLVLVLSSLLASYIPARRAASVNPIEVLRSE
jgi:macrolide transport system ATP-binding/permease protein